MTGRWTARPAAAVAVVVAASLVAAGCGGTEEPPFAFACTDGPQTVERALRAAPGRVTLPDGTTLSACIKGARDDSQLQEVGIVFSRAAEDLEERAAADPRAALELGYLVGAARSGARTGSGIQVELVRRVERSAALENPSPAAARALDEGMAAGEARG